MLEPNPPASSVERQISATAGSLVVGLRLKEAHVLVVGTGREAAARTFFALDAGANVTVVGSASTNATGDEINNQNQSTEISESPKEQPTATEPQLHPSLAQRIINRQIAWIPRKFMPSDLQRSFMGTGRHAPEDVDAVDANRLATVAIHETGASKQSSSNNTLNGCSDKSGNNNNLETDNNRHAVDLVLSCIDDHVVSTEIAHLCHRLRIPINCADIPDLCDFLFMAQFRAGLLQIGVSTGGGGPRLGARLRDAIVAGLNDDVPDAVEGVAALRTAVRDWENHHNKENANTATRAHWISMLCDAWSYNEMAMLAKEPAFIDTLVRMFAEKRNETPPSFEAVSAVTKTSASTSIIQQNTQPTGSRQTDFISTTASSTAITPIIKIEHALSQVPMVGPFFAAFMMQWLMIFVFISGIFTRFAIGSDPGNRSSSQSTASNQNGIAGTAIKAVSTAASAASAAVNTFVNEVASLSNQNDNDPSEDHESAQTTHKPGETAYAFVGKLSDRAVVVLCDIVHLVKPIIPRKISRWFRQAEMRVVLRNLCVRPKHTTQLTTASRVAQSDASGQAGSDIRSSGASQTSPKPTGSLYIVGAGPGGLDTLTLGAVTALQAADLVISDRLIPSSILDLVSPERLVLNPGKTSIVSDRIQTASNTTCMDAIMQGKTVVRLKAGDPFLFGRGSEEVLFFRERGIEPVVIAGVTSAMGGPTSAMVPLTHRGVADSVLVLSGRGAGGSFPKLPEYDPLCTVVFLMSLKRLRELSDMLVQDAGFPPDTRCVVLEKACWGAGRGERSVFGRVSDIADCAEAAGVENPAMWVVGNVVGLLHQDHDLYFRTASDKIKSETEVDICTNLESLAHSEGDSKMLPAVAAE